MIPAYKYNILYVDDHSLMLSLFYTRRHKSNLVSVLFSVGMNGIRWIRADFVHRIPLFSGAGGQHTAWLLESHGNELLSGRTLNTHGGRSPRKLLKHLINIEQRAMRVIYSMTEEQGFPRHEAEAFALTAVMRKLIVLANRLLADPEFEVS